MANNWFSGNSQVGCGLNYEGEEAKCVWSCGVGKLVLSLDMQQYGFNAFGVYVLFLKLSALTVCESIKHCTSLITAIMQN